ncbi:hypothetical protein [Streptomyces sp. NPDC045470]|uniref:hypothetical protein n=1 Tax=unclassified Streptomyces TaxID=2593676 RepID=UPI0033C0081D
MDGTVIIIVLAIAGVASVLLFALKGLLDQIPEVIASAARARDAWAGFRRAPSPPAGGSRLPRSELLQVLAGGPDRAPPRRDVRFPPEAGRGVAHTGSCDG